MVSKNNMFSFFVVGNTGTQANDVIRASRSVKIISVCMGICKRV